MIRSICSKTSLFFHSKWRLIPPKSIIPVFDFLGFACIGPNTPELIMRFMAGTYRSCCGTITRSNKAIGREGFIKTMLFPPKIALLAAMGRCVACPAPNKMSGFGR